MPDFRINPYVQPYVGGTNKEFGQVLDQKLTDYNVAADTYDVLGYQTDILAQNSANFQGDQLYARELINKYRGEIDKAAEMGDYENMGREVKRSVRNFAAEVAPLMENKKRVSDYQTTLQKQFEEGKIGVDTYQKSLKHSLSNYQGLDKNNPQGTMFSGFVPAKDYNVADGVNKFLDTFKADKSKTFSVPTKNGIYVTADIETVGKLLKNGTVSYDNMAEAVANYLGSNSDFTSYRDSQVTIGNQAKLLDELQKATKAGIEAQGYTQRASTLETIPVGTLKYGDEQNAAMMPTVVETAPGTFNPQAVDQIESQGLQVSADGIIRLNPNTSFENGKYFIYTDPKGKQITPAQYAKGVAPIAGGTGGAGFDVKYNSGYKKKEITPDEAAKYQEGVNKNILVLAKNNYLAKVVKDAAANGYNMDAFLTNQDQLNKMLEENRSKWDNPTERKKAGTEYQEAIKNSAEFIPQVARFNKIQQGVSDVINAQEFLGMATGKSVAVMSTKGNENFRDSEKKDVESLIEDQQKKKGEFIGATAIGPLNMNPYNDGQPGVQYQLRFKNDKTISTVNVIIPTNDSNFVPSQQVFQHIFQGKSGEVPFGIDNPQYNPAVPPSLSNPQKVYGKLRINSFTDKDQIGKSKFNGFIEVLDSDGNKVNVPGVPNNIPAEQFMDVWTNMFVPKATNQYQTKKQEESQLQE